LTRYKISKNNIYDIFSGESNVYTLGNIGSHRIVCTKLPTVGYTREAITAAGNTTTRLLGMFLFYLNRNPFSSNPTVSIFSKPYQNN
jgi:hypothetical protein